MSGNKLAILGLTVVISMCACGCTVVVGGGGGGASPTPDADDGVTPGGDGGLPSNANEGGTPDGGPDGPADLEVGRNSQSLAAGAKKTFRVNAESGETLIVNTSLPDSRTDVDMYAYAPNSERPIASSENGPGKSDTLVFPAETTGEYTVEVVNISLSDVAQLSLDVQRIPPRTAVSSSLNGVYEITEVDGVPPAPGTNESWMFSDGKLTSIYGSVAVEDLQALGIDADEDARFWIDATTREVCQVHFGEFDAAWQIVDTHTEQDGSSLTLTIQQHVAYQWPDESAESDQTITFEGALLDEGATLRGSVVTMIYGGDRPIELEASVKLERKENVGDT